MNIKIKNLEKIIKEEIAGTVQSRFLLEQDEPEALRGRYDDFGADAGSHDDRPGRSHEPPEVGPEEGGCEEGYTFKKFRELKEPIDLDGGDCFFTDFVEEPKEEKDVGPTDDPTSASMDDADEVDNTFTLIPDTLKETFEWLLHSKPVKEFYLHLKSLGLVVSDTWEDFLENEFSRGKLGPIFTQGFRIFVFNRYNWIYKKGFVHGDRHIVLPGRVGTSTRRTLDAAFTFFKALDAISPDKLPAEAGKITILKTIRVVDENKRLVKTLEVVRYAENKPPVTLLTGLGGGAPKIIGGYAYTGHGFKSYLEQGAENHEGWHKYIDSEYKLAIDEAKLAALSETPPRTLGINDQYRAGRDAVEKLLQKHSGPIIEPLHDSRFPDSWADMLNNKLTAAYGNRGVVGEADAIVTRVLVDVPYDIVQRADEVAEATQINKLLRDSDALKSWNAASSPGVFDTSWSAKVRNIIDPTKLRSAAGQAYLKLAARGASVIDDAIIEPIWVLPSEAEGGTPKWQMDDYRIAHRRYGSDNYFKTLLANAEDALQHLPADEVDEAKKAIEGLKLLAGEHRANRNLKRLMQVDGADEAFSGIQRALGTSQSYSQEQLLRRRTMIFEALDKVVEMAKDINIPEVPESEGAKALRKIQNIFRSTKPWLTGELTVAAELELMFSAMKARGLKLNVREYEASFMKKLDEALKHVSAEEAAEVRQHIERQFRALESATSTRTYVKAWRGLLGDGLGLVRTALGPVFKVGRMGVRIATSKILAPVFYAIDLHDLHEGGEVSPILQPFLAALMVIDPFGAVGYLYGAKSYRGLGSMGCWWLVSGPMVALKAALTGRGDVGAQAVAPPDCYGLIIHGPEGKKIQKENPKCWENMNVIYEKIKESARDGTYFDLKWPWQRENGSYWANYKHTPTSGDNPCAEGRVALLNGWFNDIELNDYYVGYPGSPADMNFEMIARDMIPNLISINRLITEVIVEGQHLAAAGEERERIAKQIENAFALLIQTGTAAMGKNELWWGRFTESPVDNPLFPQFDKKEEVEKSKSTGPQKEVWLHHTDAKGNDQQWAHVTDLKEIRLAATRLEVGISSDSWVHPETEEFANKLIANDDYAKKMYKAFYEQSMKACLRNSRRGSDDEKEACEKLAKYTLIRAMRTGKFDDGEVPETKRPEEGWETAIAKEKQAMRGAMGQMEKGNVSLEHIEYPWEEAWATFELKYFWFCYFRYRLDVLNKAITELRTAEKEIRDSWGPYETLFGIKSNDMWVQLNETMNGTTKIILDKKKEYELKAKEDGADRDSLRQEYHEFIDDQINKYPNLNFSMRAGGKKRAVSKVPIWWVAVELITRAGLGDKGEKIFFEDDPIWFYWAEGAQNVDKGRFRNSMARAWDDSDVLAKSREFKKWHAEASDPSGEGVNLQSQHYQAFYIWFNHHNYQTRRYTKENVRRAKAFVKFVSGDVTNIGIQGIDAGLLRQILAYKLILASGKGFSGKKQEIRELAEGVAGKSFEDWPIHELLYNK